jgi:hypothetical protein
MKAIRKWFNELPDEIRDRAIRNGEASSWNAMDYQQQNSAYALEGAFNWCETPETNDFWYAWHRWLQDPSQPKPTIQPADGSVVVADHSGDVNEKIESSSNHQYIEALERSNKELKIALLAEVKKAEPLTKREQFAMAAMQSIVQNPHYAKMTNDQVAESSVMQADALIAELEKPRT